MTPSGNSHTFLQLSLGRHQYLGATELTQYFVRGSHMRKAVDNITVEVEVMHDITEPGIVNTYTPGCSGQEVVGKLHDYLHAHYITQYYWSLY